MRLSGLAGAALAALLVGGLAPAASGRVCEVPPFRGATQPGGAQAQMRLTNTGDPCAIRLLADIEARQPFTTITLTQVPRHGTATILADRVAYRPNPGFRGADVFEVAASAALRGNLISGRVRVEVTVLPAS